MTVWFGLFSSGPRCSNPRCGAEVTEQEQAAYTTMGLRGPVHRCENCWATAQRQKAEEGGRGYKDAPNQRPSAQRHRVRSPRLDRIGGVQ